MNTLLKKKLFFYPLIIFLGILSSFSLPPYNFFILNFLTFSTFFVLIVKNKKKLNKFDFFVYGWLFGLGYFFSSLYWIVISLTFDSSFKTLIPVALIFIPSLIAIFYGVATYIFYFFKNFNNISLVIIFSILFSIVEYIRGNILSGFPWNLIAFSFSETLSLIQILSYIGTYSFNLICLTLFVLPGLFFLKKSKYNLFFIAFFLLLFFLLSIIGQNEINNQNNTTKLSNNFVIKVVSPTIDINRFYDVDQEKDIIKNLIQLSNPKKELKTLFIWPEGIFTQTNISNLKKYKNIFKNNFSKNHLIVLGINEVKKKNTYNSLVVVNSNLEIIDFYNKNKLVPFGEFLPFEEILKRIGLRTITNSYNSFSEGKYRNIIDLKNEEFNIKFLPLICYEIIYSGKLSKNNKNYDVIINISEDGWFGQSIGPIQHFTHSIFRAIEEGKSIIRSSNNGLSAYVSPKGEIIKKSESTHEGVFEINNLVQVKQTLFSKFGNNIFFYFLLIYISLIFFLKKIGDKTK